MAEAAIDIHWIDLDVADAAAGLLSPGERVRAARLRRPLERRRFVAGRAALRRALAERLGADPAGLRFVAGSYGKPALADTPLAFNVSHSGAMAVIAIGGERALGVDCERVSDGLVAMQEAIEPFLSPVERTALADRPGDEALVLLYRLWTRKEAVAKADGLGMGFPFAAATLLGDADRTVAVAGHGEFRVRDLVAPPGIVATLAEVGSSPLVLGEVAGLSPRSSSPTPG